MKESAGRVLMLLENNPFQVDARPRREARALVEAGYRVSVISPRPPDDRPYEKINGVRLYQFPAPREANGFLGYLWEYGYSMVAMSVISLLVFLREGFDVIHAHNPPDTFFLIAAFYKLFGKRFVYDHHDLAPEMYHARFRNSGSRLVHRTLVLLEKASCRLADRVIATNESYKAIEMERGCVPAERITIVRNAPASERVRSVDPDPALQQKASTILGYVGSMAPHDGVDYLLRALHHLIYDLDRRDVYCVIIGQGSMLPELKALAKKLHIEEYIWFTGWIPDEDLIRFLSTADICVDPDPSNPFTDRSTMTKMMEYMALGKPIVAFDLPEHRATAQSAAAYARPNSELDFAQKIAALIDNPGRRRQMGQIGRKRLETELAWKYQEKHLLEAYASLGIGASAPRHVAP